MKVWLHIIIFILFFQGPVLQQTSSTNTIDFDFEISFDIDDIPDVGTMVTYRGQGNLDLQDNDCNLQLEGVWHIEEMYGLYYEGEEEPVSADIIYTKVPSTIHIQNGKLTHIYNNNDLPIKYQSQIPTTPNFLKKIIRKLKTRNIFIPVRATIELPLNEINHFINKYLSGQSYFPWDDDQMIEVTIIINQSK